MNVLIPKFEEENPGIKVNAVSHEWADLHEKLLISAQSGTLPDVARLDSAWIPEFEKMGILTALDEEMSDYADIASGLLDSAMSTAQVGGHSYGLALNTNSKILFYNVQAFSQFLYHWLFPDFHSRFLSVLAQNYHILPTPPSKSQL